MISLYRRLGDPYTVRERAHRRKSVHRASLQPRACQGVRLAGLQRHRRTSSVLRSVYTTIIELSVSLSPAITLYNCDNRDKKYDGLMLNLHQIKLNFPRVLQQLRDRSPNGRRRRGLQSPLSSSCSVSCVVYSTTVRLNARLLCEDSDS